MQFQPGQSGNPAGRPRGSRNKATLVLQALLDGDVAEIGDRLVRRAKLGDLAAIRLCIDRILPRRREAPICFELPPIASAADLSRAYEAIRIGLASGDLAPREALELGRFAERMAASVEAREPAELSAQPQGERAPPVNNRENTGAGDRVVVRLPAAEVEAASPVNNRENTGKIAGARDRVVVRPPAAEVEAAPPVNNRETTGEIAASNARAAAEDMQAARASDAETAVPDETRAQPNGMEPARPPPVRRAAKRRARGTAEAAHAGARHDHEKGARSAAVRAAARARPPPVAMR